MNHELVDTSKKRSKVWEVADICFGKTDMDEIVHYQEVSDNLRQYYKT